MFWQHDLEANVRVPLKRKYRHFAEIFIGSYHFDNFQCRQLQNTCQHNDISLTRIRGHTATMHGFVVFLMWFNTRSQYSI